MEVIVLMRACHHGSSCSFCRRQVNWREAKGEEEINIYQSERRRRTIHSLPKESRVSEVTHTLLYTDIIVLQEYNPPPPASNNLRDFLTLVQLLFPCHVV